LKLKALIVDDEEPARQELSYLLSQMDHIEVAAEAASAREALKLLSTTDFAVVFLDIQMPGMSGLELGDVLQSMAKPPLIIFVTAFQEYALQAFEVNAVDYLVKPFDVNRLEQAVKKAWNIWQQIDPPAAAAAPKNPSLDRIPLERGGKTLLLPQQDIVFAYTQDETVYVKTVTERYVARFTLKELEQRLSPENFFRTHRCYIVNLSRIREITPYFNGTYTVTVDDHEKSEIPVSRNQARKLKKILGL